MEKKYTGATKCLITIEEGETENTISLKYEWFPKLDIKNPENNHPSVIQASMSAIDRIKRIE